MGLSLVFVCGLCIHNSLKKGAFAVGSLCRGHDANPSSCAVSELHLKHLLNPRGFLLMYDRLSSRLGYKIPPAPSFTGRFVGFGTLELCF